MKATLDMVNDHMSAMNDATMAEMAKMQPTAPGTRERSTRELNNIWKAIQSLPQETQLSVIQSMAERAGHAEGEDAPCEACGFLGSRVNAKE